ncbi:N-acetyltransferase [Actinosynnema sp. NPDC047251]|uniref:N-acetyltransferase n=1 Tax=Saccharothrix espanaensis (strain ATCC 51144 / DSM 44229 / JCM 9112 / NBRC 15066 / NRRL 15764) TaxID=1179773 RepID=K0K2K0_SACES|nr:N-acetyltransferase [Saccharothrix espanaensis]CCH34470.1 N-acetyltransferase [Saccharothrix espanaensis DSM 44229]
MLIRRETPDDVHAITAITDAAFAADPGGEAWLVTELRADTGWIPELSLVAESPEGAIIGHVVCTRAALNDGPALGLGPLSVHPDHQRRGVGKALVHAVLGAADALGEPLVALLGDPAYYSRFGFRLAAEHGVEPPNPEWAPHFQVRTLHAYRPNQRGTFRYAEPFERL